MPTKKAANHKTTKANSTCTITKVSAKKVLSPKQSEPQPAQLAGQLPATVLPGTDAEPTATPSDHSGTTLPPSPLQLCPNRAWYSQYEAVVGLSHRNSQPPLPCQDAALSIIQPRPAIIVADGAGSSAVSEIGAQAVVSGLARLLNTLDNQLISLLDSPEYDNSSQDARRFALLLVKHGKGLLDDLAVTHRRAQRDFRCTLLLVVAGKARCLWLKVGDGALVVELQAGAQQTLSALGQAGKGEFANHTQFIDDQLRPEDVQSGLMPMSDVSGLAAMSDGAAEKLVSLQTQQVAKQMAGWFSQLRSNQLSRRTLTRSFYSDAFCTGSTGDDCSVALLACELRPLQTQVN